MIFQWVTPLIRLGYKRPLKITDMWSLTSYSTDQILSQFNESWDMRPKDDGTRTVRIKRNVAFVIFRIFWPLLAFCFVLKIVQTILMFSSPIVLDWLITFMSSSNDPDWKGYLYSFLLFLISFMESVFDNQHEYYLHVLQMDVKTCLMSTVYKKALVLSNDGRRQFSTGQIVNMMSVDIKAIEDWIVNSRLQCSEFCHFFFFG